MVTQTDSFQFTYSGLPHEVAFEPLVDSLQVQVDAH